MADIDLLMARLWQAAASKGPEWLHSQVAALLEDEARYSAADGEGTARARRSWPPARYSPGPDGRLGRMAWSPRGEQSTPPAKRRHQPAAAEPGRIARRGPSLGGGAMGQNGAASPITGHRCEDQTNCPAALHEPRGGGQTGENNSCGHQVREKSSCIHHGGTAVARGGERVRMADGVVLGPAQV